MKSNSILKDLQGFLLLWCSQTVSELVTAMTNYALVIWVYQKSGTAFSITLLTLCSFMPTILLRFIGGALADRFDKKRIMLLSDLLAALGTLVILVLHSLTALQIWHLYLINLLLSCMNAVQVPASFAACSLLVPKEHYTRVSGLQSFSGAAVSILAPALGGVILAFGSMNVLLLLDLLSFAVAFFTLLLFIRIPNLRKTTQHSESLSFLADCMDGIRYLKKNKGILHITMFMAAVNFLAKLGNDGMLAPFILARTGNDEQILGIVQSSVSVGLLAGSLLLTVIKPAKNKSKLAFLSCSFIFLGQIVQSLTVRTWLWCLMSVASYFAAVVMNANLTTCMRERVPIDLHGRVFSAKDTLQNCTIPLGLFLGGVFADYVFDPLMSQESAVQKILFPLFGTGNGAGIAVQFLIVGVLGILLSLTQLNRHVYRDLES